MDKNCFNCAISDSTVCRTCGYDYKNWKYLNNWRPRPTSSKSMPTIKKIIYNSPATIVFWSDNTKTIVKAEENTPSNAEIGLSMAIAKKYFNNNYTELRKYTPTCGKTEEECAECYNFYPECPHHNFPITIKVEP